jgi:hypothetical protein
MNMRALASATLLGALVLDLAAPAGAATKPKCTPVAIDLGPTASAPGGTGLDDFPVFVHYMVNDGFPAEDPSVPLNPVPIGSASYPPAVLQNYFTTYSTPTMTGLFNALWGPNGINLVLVGMEVCTYNLPSLDPNFSNDHRFPDPREPAAAAMALKVFKRYNAKNYHVGSAVRPFKGLDLYIFWSLDGPAGYGVSPKFKTLANGAQKVQTPGGVFIDGDCQDPSNDQPDTPGGGNVPGSGCRREFSHEVGHFFSLCHCCNSGLTPLPQTATCTTSYCGDVPTAGSILPDCTGTIANRLMTTNWIHQDLTSCEITRATGTAQQILK